MRGLVSTARLGSLALAFATGAALTVETARGQTAAALPDWSGVWAMQGSTVFDRSTVRPPDGRTGQPGVREFPPYNEEWEAIYRRNINRLVRRGSFTPPANAFEGAKYFPIGDLSPAQAWKEARQLWEEDGPDGPDGGSGGPDA